MHRNRHAPIQLARSLRQLLHDPRGAAIVQTLMVLGIVALGGLAVLRMLVGQRTALGRRVERAIATFTPQGAGHSTSTADSSAPPLGGEPGAWSDPRAGVPPVAVHTAEVEVVAGPAALPGRDHEPAPPNSLADDIQGSQAGATPAVYATALKHEQQPPTGTTQAPQEPQPPAEDDNPLGGALSWLGDKAGTVKDKAKELAGAARDKAHDLLAWPIATAPERGRDILNTQRLTGQGYVSSMNQMLHEQWSVPGEVIDKLEDRDFKAALGSATQLWLQPAESNLGLGLMVLGNEFDSLQTAIAESPSRTLMSDETDELRSVFGDSIDYGSVRLKEGPLGLWNQIAAGDAKNPRPLTLGNTIYMFEEKKDGTLVHEMMHVWQYQHGGTDYIPQAQRPQLTENPAAYRWTDDVPKVAWGDLPPEKQAEFISDAYASALERHPPHFTVADLRSSANQHKRAGEPAPPLPDVDEVNRYLADALSQLRAGKGAP